MTTPTPEGEWVLTDATLSVVGSDLMLGFDTHEQAVAAMDWLETAAPRPPEQGSDAELIAEVQQIIASVREGRDGVDVRGAAKALGLRWDQDLLMGIFEGYVDLATAPQSRSAELDETRALYGGLDTRQELFDRARTAEASLAQERQRVEADRAALRGYRAATHWIGADSWDGCSDCIAILKLATHNDFGRDMTPDEIAHALKELRAQQEPEGEK